MPGGVSAFLLSETVNVNLRSNTQHAETGRKQLELGYQRGLVWVRAGVPGADLVVKGEPMEVHVFRTAMCGGGLSYDVYVPEKECPKHVLEACPGGTYYTRISRDGDGYYLDYEHATLSEEHNRMPQGIERYESWLEHEKQARREMLKIATQAFPELKQIAWRTDKLPTLWVCGLMEKETSAKVVLKV